MGVDASITLHHTHDYGEAVRYRDAGFEPIECAFGQYGSVLGPLAMDHHGAESHREGVALRACRDHFGARADDPRFVVTGTPDADAVLAIIALAGLVPQPTLTAPFWQLVNQHDTDPIGHDLLTSTEGLTLAWFNQQTGMTQSEKGFRKGINHMVEVLHRGLDDTTEARVKGSDRARRRKALGGVVTLYDADGFEVTPPADPMQQPVRRGDRSTAGEGLVLVVNSSVWGFDVWYRLAPVVVSYASRMSKVTIGCPDKPTAEGLFGSGGLTHAWEALGKGWGGRESIGGSPRGQRLNVSDADRVAHRLLPLLRAG